EGGRPVAADLRPFTEAVTCDHAARRVVARGQGIHHVGVERVKTQRHGDGPAGARGVRVPRLVRAHTARRVGYAGVGRRPQLVQIVDQLVEADEAVRLQIVACAIENAPGNAIGVVPRNGLVFGILPAGADAVKNGGQCVVAGGVDVDGRAFSDFDDPGAVDG